MICGTEFGFSHTRSQLRQVDITQELLNSFHSICIYNMLFQTPGFER